MESFNVTPLLPRSMPSRVLLKMLLPRMALPTVVVSPAELPMTTPAQATALQGIRDVALGLASDITAKVAGRTPAADSVARAVDGAAGAEAGR